MPNIATHIIIPLFCLFIFYKDKQEIHKYLIILLPFTLLPDLDLIFGLEGHRQIFHNLLFLVLIYLIIYSVKNSLLFITTFYVFSHILLDLFDGYGIGLFYPFIYENVYVYTGLFLELNSLKDIIFIFNYGFSPSEMLLEDKLPVIDSIGFLSLFFLLIAYLRSKKIK